jgi:hypothetical protein
VYLFQHYSNCIDFNPKEPDLGWYIPKLKFTTEGDSILHILCASKKWEEKDKEEQLKKLLNYLIDKNFAHVKAKNIHLRTPFHLACSLRTPAAAKALLETKKVLKYHFMCCQWIN